jgi:hypothetical protein
MKISAAFPSSYVKAADLNGKAVRVTISHVEMETIGDDRKPVLYFKQSKKGLVLNKTNANNIVFAYGDDTDDWSNKDIELYPSMVDFQGRSVEAIRVRVPRAAPAAPPLQPVPSRLTPEEEIGDAVPF